MSAGGSRQNESRCRKQLSQHNRNTDRFESGKEEKTRKLMRAGGAEGRGLLMRGRKRRVQSCLERCIDHGAGHVRTK